MDKGICILYPAGDCAGGIRAGISGAVFIRECNFRRSKGDLFSEIR